MSSILYSTTLCVTGTTSFVNGFFTCSPNIKVHALLRIAADTFTRGVELKVRFRSSNNDKSNLYRKKITVERRPSTYERGNGSGRVEVGPWSGQEGSSRIHSLPTTRSSPSGPTRQPGRDELYVRIEKRTTDKPIRLCAFAGKSRLDRFLRKHTNMIESNCGTRLDSVFTLCAHTVWARLRST